VSRFFAAPLDSIGIAAHTATVMQLEAKFWSIFLAGVVWLVLPDPKKRLVAFAMASAGTRLGCTVSLCTVRAVAICHRHGRCLIRACLASGQSIVPGGIMVASSFRRRTRHPGISCPSGNPILRREITMKASHERNISVRT